MLYRDTWKRHIPNEKLSAYKQLIDDGKIHVNQVVYERSTGITTVEYDSEMPHEWVIEELKRRCTG